MWYVGLDWADTHHDVEVLDEAGKRVGARRFAHSHAGLHELQAFLLGIAASPDQLACIVETTHGLLITFLLEAGFPVYPVNPKMANQLRKVAGAKTDRIDAHLLAKLGRLDLGELRRLAPDSPTVAELKTLTRDQDALIQTQTRLVNQVTACLKAYYPAALHLFAKVQQRSTLVFLQTYPTPQAAQAASLAEITATLRAGKHTNPTKAACKIVEELHRPHLVATELVVRAKSRLLLSLVKQLLVVIQEIAGYDKAIKPLFCPIRTTSCGGRCLGRASTWPHVCWLNGARIAAAMLTPEVARLWLGRLLSHLQAAITPKRTNASRA